MYKNKHILKQVWNPVTESYTLIDVSYGKILKYHPKKNTPYKYVPIEHKKGMKEG